MPKIKEIKLITPGSIVRNDVSDDEEEQSASSSDEDEEEIEEGVVKKEKTWEGSNEKYDPVPLPEPMIRKEYEKMQGYLPVKVRARKTEFPEAMWTGVSLDLKTSRFQLTYPNGSTREFVDPTTLLKEMLKMMTEENQNIVVPPEKRTEFGDPRLRPWDMMEGYIPEQGWFIMGRILKSMFRVKRSAETWMNTHFANRNRKRKQREISKALVKKETKLCLSFPTFQYNTKHRVKNYDQEYQDESALERIVTVKESIDEMIDRGAADEDETRWTVKQKLDMMDWQQLTLMNMGADRIMMNIPHVQDKKIMYRRTSKRQLGSSYDTDDEEDIKVKIPSAGHYNAKPKVVRVKGIQGPHGSDSESEGEATQIRRIKLTALRRTNES